MNAHEDGLYFTPYLAYQNKDHVIETLTPLVTLLLKIDKLVKPTDSVLTYADDVADVFANSPDFFIRHVAKLEREMKKKKLMNPMIQLAIKNLICTV